MLKVLFKCCKLVRRAIRMSDVRSALHRNHRDKVLPRPKVKIKTASPTPCVCQHNSLQFIVENERVLRDVVRDPSRLLTTWHVFGSEELEMIQFVCDSIRKLKPLQALFSVNPALTEPVRADVFSSVSSVFSLYPHHSEIQYSKTIER